MRVESGGDDDKFGLKFRSCGRIRFSNAARNLTLPSSDASGALTMCRVRRAHRRHRCRETAASDASSNTSRSDRPRKYPGAVAVMDVEIDHRGAADAVFALGVTAAMATLSKKQKPIGLLTSA